MVKHGLEEVNLINPLDGKLAKVIDAFVKFYGEDARDRITKRLNDTRFYFEPRKSSQGIHSIDKRFKMLEKGLDTASETYQEDLEYLRSEKSRLKNFQVKNVVEQSEQEYEGKLNELIINHFLKYFPVKNVEGFTNDVKGLIPLYQDFVLKRTEFVSQNDMNLYQYMVTLIGNSANVNGVKDVQQIKRGLAEIIKKDNTMPLKVAMEKLLDERNDRILTGSEIASFAKDIKNLSLYRKSEMIDEVFSFILDPGSQGFDILTVDLRNPNKTLNFCFCNAGLELDQTILIHEMNHAVASRCALKNGAFSYKTGFYGRREILDGDKIVKADVVSNCNTLNEVVNEYLAIKIDNILREEGVRLGVKERGASDYVLLFPVFEDFFEEHLDDIKKCYLSDDPRSFAKVIGEENFDKIAKIADNMMSSLLEMANDNDVYLFMKRSTTGERIGKKVHRLSKADLEFSDDFDKYLSFYRQADEVFKEIDKFTAEKKQKLDTDLEGYGFNEFDF